jgi:hypothetical protein
MMLASTVQFSKYGRSRPCITLAGEERNRSWPRLARGVKDTFAAVPSGPNSVLGPPAPRTRVPSPKRLY